LSFHRREKQPEEQAAPQPTESMGFGIEEVESGEESYAHDMFEISEEENTPRKEKGLDN